MILVRVAECGRVTTVTNEEKRKQFAKELAQSLRDVMDFENLFEAISADAWGDLVEYVEGNIRYEIECDGRISATVCGDELDSGEGGMNIEELVDDYIGNEWYDNDDDRAAESISMMHLAGIFRQCANRLEAKAQELKQP